MVEIAVTRFEKLKVRSIHIYLNFIIINDFELKIIELIYCKRKW